MKKVITQIVFLFAFVFMANAQKQPSTLSNNQMATVMSLFVTNVKPAYQKGQTYKEFEKTLLGNWNNTPEGSALLSKAFQYISKSISSEQIIKEYSGLEMANAYKASINAQRTNRSTDGVEVFGGKISDVNVFSEKAKTSGCKWYQLGCYVESISMN